MALVDYSSEDSDSEDKHAPQELARIKTNPSKPTFQKVFDRSHPHKIRVSLPEPSKSVEVDESERPVKRAKIGSGSFSGFNALLPSPKRAATTSGGPLTSNIKRGGLGSGISLKTETAPGFSRELVASADAGTVDGEEAVLGETIGVGRGLDMDQKPAAVDDDVAPPKPVEESKPKGKTAMFKPLSVARKPQKKSTPKDSLGGLKSRSDEGLQHPKATPKVSLFSTEKAHEPSRPELASNGTYQPMVYSADEPSTELQPEDSIETESYTTSTLQPTSNEPSKPQSLTSIAADLNLSASQKRQLLGRQKHNSNSTNPNSTPINIVNFNTDAEYTANELLRQAGETVQHNPVRAIAPGKHSLKQLVNAASNQKDALEESFASGRRNKKEAGSKYGW